MSDVTSPGGTSLWWMEYTPFGAARASASTSQAPLNYFRFTGAYLDLASGLYHLRARAYDPATGRFLSTDPLAAPITSPALGSYVYVGNNPTNRVDPSGRETLRVCVTGGLGWGPFGVDIDLCITVSDSGQAGVTGTLTGAGGANLDAYAGVGFQASNADDLSDLASAFGVAGGSGVLVVGVQGSTFAGVGHCGQNVTGASGAIVVGGGGSAFAGGQYTGVAKISGPDDRACQSSSGLAPNPGRSTK